MADLASALQLISAAIELAKQLDALDDPGADELRETALHFEGLTMKLSAYTTSRNVALKLVEALERQMERDSRLLERLIESGQLRLVNYRGF